MVDGYRSGVAVAVAVLVAEAVGVMVGISVGKDVGVAVGSGVWVAVGSKRSATSTIGVGGSGTAVGVDVVMPKSQPLVG